MRAFLLAFVEVIPCVEVREKVLLTCRLAVKHAVHLIGEYIPYARSLGAGIAPLFEHGRHENLFGIVHAPRKLGGSTQMFSAFGSFPYGNGQTLCKLFGSVGLTRVYLSRLCITSRRDSRHDCERSGK